MNNTVTDEEKLQLVQAAYGTTIVGSLDDLYAKLVEKEKKEMELKFRLEMGEKLSEL